MEEQYAQTHAAEPVRMHREAYDRARRLNNVQKVFEFDKDWEKSRERYGDTKIGRRMMIARSLVEAGVAFVEVGQSGYDTHADNFSGHKSLVPPMEKAWAGLLDDLEERGLLDDTVVVWMGEIGRTPRINNRSGRDHYVRCLDRGPGGRRRQTRPGLWRIRRRRRGCQRQPGDRSRLLRHDLSALGVNPATENYTGVRPIPLAPFGHKVVKDILA